MGTMGTLAVGIQSWLKFGKATISFAAGGTQRSAKMSTNSEIANLANTQMSKVCFDRPIKSNIAMFIIICVDSWLDSRALLFLSEFPA